MGSLFIFWKSEPGAVATGVFHRYFNYFFGWFVGGIPASNGDHLYSKSDAMIIHLAEPAHSIS